MAHFWKIFIPPLCLAAALASPASGQGTYTVRAVRDGGTVKGTVKIGGTSPRAVAEAVTKDAAWCGRTKPPARLLVGAGGGVKNAVVYIERIAGGKEFPSGSVAVLHQHKCEYVPHVLLMTPAMCMEIVNEDPILHNVHGYQSGTATRSLFNIAQPVKGQRTRIGQEQLTGVGDVFTTCDAGHPWMSAYIIRARHPYYAVTDADGKFELDNVPPGTYVLEMWHEGVAVRSSGGGAGTHPVVEEPYELSQAVEVTLGGTHVINFSL